MLGSFVVVPGAAAGPPGVVTGRVWVEVAEARAVERARVAGDEPPALLALVPVLDLDAVVGGDTAGTLDLVVIAEDGAIAVGVEVGRGGARQHGYDADLVPAEVQCSSPS
ncbi:hypothetical protein [Myxococcus qinghaiensis]|uniref:hypothetical protein n=1 Tax=Myxococcus qinghaiensis TaxID=2906758 RepID=UPI0020A81E8F|nr:hypothetical protein [Myxococcus qinghaiensis]MCP3164550.1 hypothetical protein [Myxococcus qinghaiensis]